MGHKVLVAEAAELSGEAVNVSWSTFQGKAFASRLHPGQLLTGFRGFGRDGRGGIVLVSQLPGNKAAPFPEFL